MSSPQRLKIFAHDAASANATFAYALQQSERGFQVEAFGRGPAQEIFQRRIPQFVKSGDPVFHADDIVVTGLSGLHSRYELEMVFAAKTYGVSKTISIMDMPYGLDVRFKKDNVFLGERYLPDEIWISKIAEVSAYPEIAERLRVRENPYWDFVFKTQYHRPPEILQEFIRRNKDNYVLFLTDYISEIWGDDLGFTEFTILDRYLQFHKKSMKDKPILLRLHPAEKKDKYDAILQTHPDLLIYRSQGELAEELYYCSLVCGMLTSVFYESTLIRKPSVSLQLGSRELRHWYPDGVQVAQNEAELEKIVSVWKAKGAQA